MKIQGLTIFKYEALIEFIFEKTVGFIHRQALVERTFESWKDKIKDLKSKCMTF